MAAVPRGGLVEQGGGCGRAAIHQVLTRSLVLDVGSSGKGVVDGA
jgi:hypothetical protein